MKTTSTTRTTTADLVGAYQHWQDASTFLLRHGRSWRNIEELARDAGTSTRTAYRNRAAWRRLVGE